MSGKHYLRGKLHFQTDIPVELKFIFRNDCCIVGRCYEMVGCVDPEDLSARLFKVRKIDHYVN